MKSPYLPPESVPYYDTLVELRRKLETGSDELPLRWFPSSCGVPAAQAVCIELGLDLVAGYCRIEPIDYSERYGWHAANIDYDLGLYIDISLSQFDRKKYRQRVFEYPLLEHLKAYARDIPDIAILPQDNLVMIPDQELTRKILERSLNPFVEKMFRRRIALLPSMKPGPTTL